MIHNVVGDAVDVEDVLVVIDVGHGEAELQGVALTEVEFLLRAEVEAVIAGQSRLDELG